MNQLKIRKIKSNFFHEKSKNQFWRTLSNLTNNRIDEIKMH